MYSDQRAVLCFDLKTADMAGTPADNTDLFSFIVPAGKEIEIQGFRADVRLAGAASSTIELVKNDNTVLCEVKVSSTGMVSAVNAGTSTATTFPIRVAPQSTTVLKNLKLRVNGTLDATTDVGFQIHVSGLSAA